MFISKQEQEINEQIKDKEVRLIGEDGSQLGIMPRDKALKMAEESSIDLVKIAPNAVPPVCKIMDYGKYRFEQSKREKESRKAQKIIEIKEIRLSLNIDVHDFETKKNHAIKFLKDGDKVKASIRLRGRERGHPEMGIAIMEKFANALDEYSVVEKPAKFEGRGLLMFLVPKKL